MEAHAEGAVVGGDVEAYTALVDRYRKAVYGLAYHHLGHFEDARDVAIPGQPYTFSVLKQAQAIGDMKSLTSRRLPVLRVTLGREPAAGWRALAAAVKAAAK